MRDLVKTYWTATQEALERDDVARADALARQLQSLTRNLAATERVWKETQEQYGGLVSRERLIRFFLLYKKAIDNAVCDLPESDRKDRLIDTLDRITMQLRADLKAGQAIA